MGSADGGPAGTVDGMAQLTVVRGDITRERVDAVVNAANSSLSGGGGVDGAIHAAGGPSILAECRAIVARDGQLPPGRAVATGAGDLPARHVIHTVGPIWSAAEADDHDATLASCYRECLLLAAELHAVSIAFPNISTGVYGFPKRRAADVAVETTRSVLAELTGPLRDVRFVCFDEENHQLYLDRVETQG